jgi:hypothetical protein
LLPATWNSLTVAPDRPTPDTSTLDQLDPPFVVSHNWGSKAYPSDALAAKATCATAPAGGLEMAVKLEPLFVVRTIALHVPEPLLQVAVPSSHHCCRLTAVNELG